MTKMIRLVLGCSITTAAACASEPTAPTAATHLPTPTARHDLDPNRLDNGLCRSGYEVANGRCTAI